MRIVFTPPFEAPVIKYRSHFFSSSSLYVVGLKSGASPKWRSPLMMKASAPCTSAEFLCLEPGNQKVMK
jgi:hypothetical protein